MALFSFESFSGSSVVSGVLLTGHHKISSSFPSMGMLISKRDGRGAFYAMAHLFVITPTGTIQFFWRRACGETRDLVSRVRHHEGLPFGSGAAAAWGRQPGFHVRRTGALP